MRNVVLADHLGTIGAPVELIRLVGEDDLAVAVGRMGEKMSTSFWIVWMIGASPELLAEMTLLGLSVNCRHDGTGAMPLQCAAAGGRTEMVEQLIAQGADIEARCRLGYTPLLSAALKGRAGVIEALLTKGAQVNARLNNGFTPLQIALHHHDDECAQILWANGGQIR